MVWYWKATADLHFLVQRMDVFYSTAASETIVFWIIPQKLCGTSICIHWSAVYHRFVLLFTPFVNLHIQANWLVCLQVHCAELEVIRVWTLHQSTRLSLRRPRRHRRRCAHPAAAVGVGGGCVTPPPPPTSASAAAAALPRRRCSGRRWRRFHRRRRRDFAAGARVWPLPGPQAGWQMPSGTAATFCRTLNTLAIQYLCTAAFQSQFCSRAERTISWERYIPGIYPV